MSNLDNIFKSYDIRGIYPDTIDEDLAYKIGKATSDYLAHGTIAVGRDMRLGSAKLQQALIKGLTEQGSDVVDLGLISTDMVYFACGKYSYAGGIMLTASHNPSQYAGMKFCREDAIPLSKSTGLAEIQHKVETDDYKTPSKDGSVSQRDILSDWLDHAISFIDLAKIKPLKVVVDAGNGMAGAIIPEMAKRFPIEIVPLYFELDGTFPNHLASPIEPENMADTQSKVREVKADLGMAFDGDADRVFLTDEKGRIVSGTIMTAMIAKMLLSKRPNSIVLYNVICGDIVPETIKANHGTPYRTKVGHSIIKQDMRDQDGLFAGEHSGHYYFRDNFYADSGLIAALIVLELISLDGRPLSEIMAEFEKYHASGEINSTVQDQQAKIAEIKETYADGQQDELDGITIRYPAWWCNIRQSNTEPLLRLNVEARDKSILDAKVAELLALIRS